MATTGLLDVERYGELAYSLFKTSTELTYESAAAT